MLSVTLGFVLSCIVCILYIFHHALISTVPDTPSYCIIAAIYIQSSGKLVSINSTWDTVPVSHVYVSNDDPVDSTGALY